MILAGAPIGSRPAGGLLALTLAVLLLATLPWGVASAQNPPIARTAAGVNTGATRTPDEARPVWAALTSSQQQALAPLKAEWATIDASRKQKWLDVAGRMPNMGASERERIQQRMAEWVKLSPAERGRARLQFQETRQMSADTRQEQWQAYQALPPDRRQALAANAAQAPKKASLPAAAGATPAAAASRETQAKRNVVAMTPQPAPSPRAVLPTVVQSRPGATTSLVTTPSSPPAHHQPGLPKVNAGAGFVDQATLLPKRGPQGAAALTSAAPAAPAPVRQ